VQYPNGLDGQVIVGEREVGRRRGDCQGRSKNLCYLVCGWDIEKPGLIRVYFWLEV
jgi:hypothetical protein